ncbi:MAG: hypothetical protein EOP58_14420 [Sphingomonadales bacterium]|jgi:hypothetical protein|nr:MAG: hypothetical protein EOP58_14420 [Sphingomonadales bacterium]
METAERTYLLLRAEQERRRAAVARDGPARLAHQSLADSYAARAADAVILASSRHDQSRG